jgi:hypothetical protein
MEFHGSTIVPTDPNFSNVVREYMQAQAGGTPTTASGGPTVIDVSSLTPDQVAQGINQGFYPSGTVLKTSAGQITVP